MTHENSESSSEADPLELDELADANSSWNINARVLSEGLLDKSSERTCSEEPLAEAVINTELILDQLIKLGFAVRQSGTTARLQKADRSFTPNSQDDFRDYLAHVLLAQVTNQKQLEDSEEGEARDMWTRRRDHYKNLDLLSSVQLKLIEANVRRRHRFNYAKRHAGRLAEQGRVLHDGPDLRRTIPPSNESRDNPTPSAIQKHKEIQSFPEHAASTRNTITTATQVEEQFVPKLSATAPSQRDDTVVSITIQKLHYPRPPLRTKDQKAFTCPCCFQTLSEEQAQTNLWRWVSRHCIFTMTPLILPENILLAIFVRTRALYQIARFRICSS